MIRGPHHALAPLLAVALAACGKDASLPLDMGPGDVAVLVSTVDGRAVPHTRPYVAGEAIQVPSDPDKPIYAWVLRASDQVTPQGAAVPAELLAATAARLVPDPADPSGATGACGRCLLATATAPMVVQAGDACPLPHFMRGSVWRKVDGAFVCRGAEGSSVCPAGDAADDGEIEEVRRRLRIDRPGACACAEPEAPDALQGMEMRAIAPAANPIPLTIYAKNSAGQVAGFSQAGSGLFEPATGRADVTPISEWPITVKTTVALRNGDFLVTGDAFNSGAVDEQSYYRFRPGPAGLEGPTRVEPSAPVLAERMRYLGGPTNDFPLYLIGGIRDALGIGPAVFACTDDRLACQQVNFTECPTRIDFSHITDAVLLDNGFGLGVARNALYYKTPSPGGGEPNPRDTWRCAQPTGPFEGPGPEDPPVRIARFVAAGASGDRAYLCGVVETPACEAESVVVLTATAGAADPQWRVAHRGPANSWCADFLPRPGGMTFVRSGYRLVHMDAAGVVTGSEDAVARYGPVDGFSQVNGLGDGWLLARASENRAFVATASAAFAPLYGPVARQRREFLAAAPRAGGGFWAFGETDGPVAVRIQESGGRFTGAEVQDTPDTSGLLAGARITGAAVDPGDPSVVVVAGRKEGPFLARLTLGEGGVVSGTRLEVPAEAEELFKVAAVGPGTFIASSRTTRLYAWSGGAVSEVDVRWDRPDTEDEERRPADPVNGCTGAVGRLDLWRALAGGAGAAHAVGARGLVFRIHATGPGAFRAERFTLPETTQVSAAGGLCPDQALIAGRGEVVDSAGINTTTVQFFELAEQEEPRKGETPTAPLDPRRATLSPVGVMEVETLNVWDLRNGVPRAVLPDRPPTGGARGRSFGVVLDNGLVHRMGSGQGLRYLRVPFRPEAVAQDAAGYVLFGAGDGRLALGIPGARVLGGSN